MLAKDARETCVRAAPKKRAFAPFHKFPGIPVKSFLISLMLSGLCHFGPDGHFRILHPGGLGEYGVCVYWTFVPRGLVESPLEKNPLKLSTEEFELNYF